MALSAKDVIEILRTLDELGYQRFRYEQDDVLLEVDATAGGEPAPSSPLKTVAAGTAESAAVDGQTPALPEAPAAAPPREGLVSVDCPMTGTFYRAPSPDAPPFVEVGSEVNARDTVCLVDVMKLFNSVPAGVAGTVTGICAENEAQVKAGQPLMWIDPAG